MSPNFGLLDTSIPYRIGQIPAEARRNALAERQMAMQEQQNALSAQRQQQAMDMQQRQFGMQEQKMGMEQQEQRRKFGEALRGKYFSVATPENWPQVKQSFLQEIADSGIFSGAEVAKLDQALPAQWNNIMEAATKPYRPAMKLEKIDRGGSTELVQIDPRSGEVRGVGSWQKTMGPGEQERIDISRATAAAAQDANEALRETSGAKRTQDVEMKLADDYRTESKGFAETSTAFKKVKAALVNADKNPGEALAAGTAFMKILDPNSVVRESELGMALNASGWFDRASNIANTMQKGKIMTAAQAKNLGAAADTLWEEAKAAQRQIDQAYSQRARMYGGDPANVIINRGQVGVDMENIKPGRTFSIPAADIQAEMERRGIK